MCHPSHFSWINGCVLAGLLANGLQTAGHQTQQVTESVQHCSLTGIRLLLGSVSFTLSFNVLQRGGICNICYFHIAFKMYQYVGIKMYSRKKIGYLKKYRKVRKKDSWTWATEWCLWAEKYIRGLSCNRKKYNKNF